MRINHFAAIIALREKTRFDQPGSYPATNPDSLVSALNISGLAGIFFNWERHHLLALPAASIACDFAIGHGCSGFLRGATLRTEFLEVS